MSLTMRIIFYGLIGIVSGLIAWPCVETFMYFQPQAPSLPFYSMLLFYSIVLGAVIGLVMGICFGMTEGMIQKTPRKIVRGLVTGLIIGLVGGVIGIFAGQAAGLFIGTTFSYSLGSDQGFAYLAAKAIGWAAFGIFIGIVEGVRSRSLAKIRNGLLGGLIGGLVGGLLFEILIKSSLLPEFLGRLAGLVVLGFFIGLFYGLIENKLARATLLALNGPEKGKEFLLTQNYTTIGGEETADMTIAGSTELAPEHAILRRKKNEIIVQDNKSRSGTFVNDKKIIETVVEDGDVIRVGETQFLFRKK